MHGYFLARKFLVLASVRLARHSETYDFNEFLNSLDIFSVFGIDDNGVTLVDEKGSVD